VLWHDRAARGAGPPGTMFDTRGRGLCQWRTRQGGLRCCRSTRTSPPDCPRRPSPRPRRWRSRRRSGSGPVDGVRPSRPPTNAPATSASSSSTGSWCVACMSSTAPSPNCSDPATAAPVGARPDGSLRVGSAVGGARGRARRGARSALHVPARPLARPDRRARRPRGLTVAELRAEPRDRSAGRHLSRRDDGLLVLHGSPPAQFHHAA
jgi:hypothetical protein